MEEDRRGRKGMDDEQKERDHSSSDSMQLRIQEQQPLGAGGGSGGRKAGEGIRHRERARAGRSEMEGEEEGQWLLQTAQEETPIGGLQTPKVAIIAQSGGTSPPLFTRFIYQCQ